MTTVTHDIEAVIRKYINDARTELVQHLIVDPEDIDIDLFTTNDRVIWAISIGDDLYNEEGSNLLDLVTRIKLTSG